jgi:hypothetical protein
MYPAKFTFDVNGAADCTNDFVVFALNLASSSTQAGIVAFNNLYSSYPTPGFCGFSPPTVKWAYNTTPGGITTSPVLSLDGAKVAYMENSSPPAFHVLTIGTTGNNGTITAPATPGVGNNAVDVRVALGTAPSDKGSPVFVVYDAPSLTNGCSASTGCVAYVGADDGKLYKITGVFGATPALAGAPWPLTVSLTSNGKVLTGPVLDSITQRIFIGTGDGLIKMARLSASDPCTGSVPAPCVDSTVLNLNSTGSHAIIDPPIVDSTNQTVFVFLNNNGAGNFAFAQATTSLGSPVIVAAGANTGQPVHAGAFDNAYLSWPGTGTNPGAPVLVRHGRQYGSCALGHRFYRVYNEQFPRQRPAGAGGEFKLVLTGD